MIIVVRVLILSIAITAICGTALSQSPVPDSVFLKENYIKRDYQIPMRDGVKLYTAVYIPRDTLSAHPMMLTRTPYSVGPYGDDHFPKSLGNLARRYFHRNYIIVSQDVRGRYMSEGTFADVRPYIEHKKSDKDIDESSDTYDSVDWLVNHIPHNNGKVGVKGSSYPGFYTTMASIDAHPAVKATSPQAPVSEWMKGDDFVHNGALLLPHFFDFYMSFGWPRPEPLKHYPHHFDSGTPDGYQFFMNLGALSNIDPKYFHDSITFWNDLSSHGKWDSFWEARDVLPHVKNIKPATMVVGGWFDTENLFGALHLYQEIHKDNPAGHHTIVMGPWAHGWWLRDNVDSLGAMKWGMNVSDYYADSLELPYFEYYLHNGPEPSFAQAIVFETGANMWHKLESWPPSNLTPTKLYLRENGKLSLDPPANKKKAYDEYVSDPQHPVPYTNEIHDWYNPAFMLEDQRFAARRPDVLAYESEPLEQDFAVAGPITAHIVGSTSGTDCDWIVKLIDVFPDSAKDPRSHMAGVALGGYQMMVRGDVLRGKFRNSLGTPEPIKPNTPTAFEYTLQDVFHQFRKGHRIMVQIQSTWFPMIDRNPGTFLDIYHAKDSDFKRTTQRVYHSGANASYITVGRYH